MKFTTTDFLNQVKILNTQNHYYGNEILYKSFGFGTLPSPSNPTPSAIGKLSSAIWLIGKSYSADPSRSAVNFTKNNGIGSAFDTIATNIVNDKRYDTFYKKISHLNSLTFNYSNSSNDKSILDESIKCVSLLNEMVKDAMGNNSKNVISFCSKLLHFICPNIFFIIDSFSFDGGIGLFSGNCDKIFKLETIPQPQWIDIDASARNFFKTSLTPIPVNNATIKPYADHCIRAYTLASYFYINHISCIEQILNDPNSKYMTRLVDSVLMRIQK